IMIREHEEIMTAARVVIDHRLGRAGTVRAVGVRVQVAANPLAAGQILIGMVNSHDRYLVWDNRCAACASSRRMSRASQAPPGGGGGWRRLVEAADEVRWHGARLLAIEEGGPAWRP